MGTEYSLTAEKIGEGFKYSPSDSLRGNPFLQEELEETAKKILVRNPKRQKITLELTEDVK